MFALGFPAYAQIPLEYSNSSRLCSLMNRQLFNLPISGFANDGLHSLSTAFRFMPFSDFDEIPLNAG